jgi:hypothetical protein
VQPDVLSRNQHSFESSRRSAIKVLFRHEFAAGMFLPALTQVARRATQGQAIADFAALACSLERYRLRNGQYPDSLTALAPDFIVALPKDWITGLPYQFRKTDTSFVLYSVGWDQKDGGGDTRLIKADDRQGDWVWGYVFP